MEEKKEVTMIECPEPGCAIRLPEDDLQGQIKHMKEKHPNSQIVEERQRRIYGRY